MAAGERCSKRTGLPEMWWPFTQLAFVIDLALPGSKRKQRFGSGFATKASALEAMNRLQAAVVTAPTSSAADAPWEPTSRTGWRRATTFVPTRRATTA